MRMLLDFFISLVFWQHLVMHQSLASTLGESLGQKLEEFANNGLGWQDFQDYLDTDITFNHEPLDGPTLAKQIAQSMSEKLDIRIKALKELQQQIQTVYTERSYRPINPFTDCCYVQVYEKDKLLNTEVNYDTICTTGQGASISSIFLPPTISDILKQQYQKALGIKYAYFGSEEGVMFNYPSLRYCSSTYDPRFRPWYKETSTPEPKDVVIIIDRSGSMGNLHEGRSLMDIAKEAAITILDTMNPNDRVGIVSFSDTDRKPSGTVYTSACYQTELAKASSQNKEYLANHINSLRPGGGTSYSVGLQAAFDYFENSQDITNGNYKRDKVILFLTDGEPTDDLELIYKTISDRNGELHNEIVILTYGLGPSLSENGAGTILTNMATQVNTNKSNGEIKVGIYTPVRDPSRLRESMGSYYDFFLTEAVTEPVFSIPYLDAFGTGLLISMCLPVTDAGSLKGVVCVDLSVDDLLSDIAYFREGQSSYAFIVDDSARVLTHPLLPSPSEITNNPYFIYLDTLEPINKIDDIIQSMTSGGNDSIEQSSLKIISRGDVQLEGVYTTTILATYSWYPIAGTSFSICIVLANGETRTVIDWDEAYPEYTYHRLDLARDDLSTCALFNRVALQDSSSVTFAARAFVDPFVYLFSEETTSTLDEYDTYLRGYTEVNPGFKEGIRNAVAITKHFEDIMQQREGYDLNVAWTYLSTDSGIHRTFPGVEIPKNYDATLRSWNQRARSHLGLVTVSAPYEDAFGAGTVVTLSKALYEGDKSGDHTSDTEVFAVLGLDFTIQYFYNLMTETSDGCSNYGCIVIDNAGFIIGHLEWLYPLSSGSKHDTSNVHLARQEPYLAGELVRLGFMISKGCVNVVELRDQFVWLVSLASAPDRSYTSRSFDIHEVKNTNLFLIVKKSHTHDTCDACEPSYMECPTYRETASCYCQCYQKANIYRYCEGVFDLSSDTLPPCPPPVPSVSFAEVNTKDELKVENLQDCGNYNCVDASKASPGECTSVLTCSWCMYEGDSSQLDQPYCTVNDICPNGRLPYSDDGYVDDGDDDNGSGSKWWISLIVLGILCVIGLAFFLNYQKRKAHSGGRSQRARSQNMQNSAAEATNRAASPASADITFSSGYTNTTYNHVEDGSLPPPYTELTQPVQSGFASAPPPAYDHATKY